MTTIQDLTKINASVLLRKGKFWLKAKSLKGHGVHSPFVYSFLDEVLNDDRYFHFYDTLSRYNQKSRDDKRDKKQTVHFDNGCKSLKTKELRLLFRMVHHYKPTHILDLLLDVDSSAAVTSCVMASADKVSTLVTALVNNYNNGLKARKILSTFQVDNVHIETWNGKDAFDRINFEQFEMIIYHFPNSKSISLSNLPELKEHTIWICTGIHFSNQVSQFWQKWIGEPNVAISISMWRIGILVISKKHYGKQHFSFRF